MQGKVREHEQDEEAARQGEVGAYKNRNMKILVIAMRCEAAPHHGKSMCEFGVVPNNQS